MFGKSPWLILLAVALLQSSTTAEEPERYEILGRLTQSDGQPPPCGTRAVVILSSVGGPFSAEAIPEQNGLFKFRDLEPGLYSAVAALPNTPEVRKTVEVGPDFADLRRRVELELQFRAAAADSHTVTVEELAIPESAREEHAKSRLRLIRRDLKGAIACLKKALKLAPWFSAAWNDLGTIAYQSHNYDEAESCFRQALKQEPDSYSPLVNLGTVLLSKKNHDESLAVNRRAVAENPGDPMAQAQLGMSYLCIRDEDMALVHLKKAKELDPAHFSYPQLALARIYLRRKDYRTAASEYREFLQLHPGSRLAGDIRSRLENLPQ